jgi:hypothetical protein
MRSKAGLVAVMLAVLVPATCRATLVTSDEAMTVGTNFLEYMVDVGGSWGGAENPEIVGCYDLVRDGRLLGYHLSVHPSGHIVVSVLKELSPVKSFSFTEDYQTDSEEGYWLLLKDAVEYTLVAMEDRYGALPLLGRSIAPAKVGEQWDWLLGSGPAPTSVDSVGPLLKTRWNQGVPLNDSCPMGDGGRCVVGCVATAASQIMRYWRHPSYGTGSHSYYWNGDQSCGGSTSGQTLGASFDHPYDWWNMKKWYVTYNPIQAAAVAVLCSDVGIAFDMDYGYCGSSSGTYKGVTVYPGFFKYLGTVSRHDRDEYPDADSWFATIREEIDASPPRPIHYRISGHSIVCDGYMDTGTPYIHLNYGWAGSHDDWYAVDSLYCPWAGCDPMVEYMLCGIEPGADYIDVTAGPLGGTDATYGVAWGDYDDDGDPDIYIVNASTANKLLRNDGGGVFVDVTSGPLGDTGEGRAACWGDYNNDGNLDLYLTNSSGQANRLFRNDGGGTFTDVTTGAAGDTGDGESAAWGDYNGDGYIDLYVVNNGSANVLLDNTAGLFFDVTSGPLGDTGSGYGMAWGDYDNDGDPDIYLANNGANKLFRNDGSGIFTDVTASPLDNGDDGRGTAWADYGNDGDLDIYLANNGTDDRIFRNDGSGAFVDVTASPIGIAPGCQGVAWGDYNNDGNIDIYVSRTSNGNRVYRNVGDGTFGKGTVTPLDDGGDGRGVAYADYDGDGLVDLYLANSDGANRLFHNEYQPDNHWLKVRLAGVYSNAAGIGARVRVVAGGVSQIREISGGSGYCSQNSLIASFGLGDLTTVDTVEVAWPSGLVTDTVLVAADQLINVIELDLSAVRKTAQAGTEVRLYQSHPTPFDQSTVIRYAVPEATPVSIRVYDVAGRVVRVLVDSGHVGAGEHSVRWDGTNDRGTEVSSGVYFYRLDAGSHSMTRRTVFLR